MIWEEQKVSIIISICLVFVAFIIFFGYTVTGRSILTDERAALKKVDEASYENKKDVEDTCRSMIVSYKSDVDVYNLYKESTSENQRAYADAARVRALRTAHQYNEYMLKNSYVWRDNIPEDIAKELDTNF